MFIPSTFLQSVHSETYHASQPASQPASNRCYGPTINPIELLKSMENTNPKSKKKEHKIIISQQTKQNRTNKQTNNDAALHLRRSCQMQNFHKLCSRFSSLNSKLNPNG